MRVRLTFDGGEAVVALEDKRLSKVLCKPPVWCFSFYTTQEVYGEFGILSKPYVLFLSVTMIHQLGYDRIVAVHADSLQFLYLIMKLG